MNINKYVDYKGLFDATFKECKTRMETYIERDLDMCDYYQKILDFVGNGIKDKLLLVYSRCSISRELISFCFSNEIQTTDESDHQNKWFNVTISYDTRDEIFNYYCQNNKRKTS